MTAQNTAILGGGALGLTLAWRLAKAGERVVVFEREAEAGGLAAGFRVGERGPWLEKFYHHLFATDRDAIALIEELGLGSKMTWRTPNSSMLIGGTPYRLDSDPRSILSLAPLPMLDRLRLGAGGAILKFLPSPEPLAGSTAAAWLSRWMGPRAYETVWKPMLEGKFGERADDIAMPWMWARAHYRTLRLGYLLGGFQQIYDGLVAGIEARGGEARLGVEVREIRPDGQGLRVTSSQGKETFTRVISTLPTRLTCRLTPDLPADYRARYDWGEAFGAHCLILALDRPLLPEHIYWLAIGDDGYPFLNAIEHTNFIGPEEYGGRRLVYFGNYVPMSHPVLRDTPEQALDRYLPGIQRLNPAFEREWITDMWGFAAPWAQPIVTREYASHIPPHETPIPNLYVANMFQVYPQDRGQNYSIRLANQLARRLLAGA
ncbi:MAG TPA: NAD(P)/FAD-dependent oxidoreductase [Ktedonobacterales bacterium]|nr:NAD(P)/FAD-dependent oxidoreductase [Ktedonobacterales bacterium]